MCGFSIGPCVDFDTHLWCIVKNIEYLQLNDVYSVIELFLILRDKFPEISQVVHAST
jgi:hypothetical protein